MNKCIQCFIADVDISDEDYQDPTVCSYDKICDDCLVKIFDEMEAKFLAEQEAKELVDPDNPQFGKFRFEN